MRKMLLLCLGPWISFSALSESTINEMLTAGEASIEVQQFRFSYFRVPLGEVSLFYGDLADRRSGVVPDSQVTQIDEGAGAPSTLLPVEPAGIARHTSSLARQTELKPLSLVGLAGRTNGVVRWLKQYEGRYQSLRVDEGLRYRVSAFDRGHEEIRDILFSSTDGVLGMPRVLAFKDRTLDNALEPDVSIDDTSLDPVALMRRMLLDVGRHGACPLVPIQYRVFDGKRRYPAIMGAPKRIQDSQLVETQHELDADALREPSAGSAVAREATRRVEEPEEGLSATVDGWRSDFALASTEPPKSKRAGGAVPESGAPHEQLANAPESGQASSLAQRGAAPGTQSIQARTPEMTNADVPRLFSCQLTLKAIDKKPQSLGANQDRPQEEAGPEQEKLTLAPQADQVLATAGDASPKSATDETVTKAGLLWPFNQKALTIGFDVRVGEQGPRFETFLVEAPMGSIKGIVVSQ